MSESIYWLTLLRNTKLFEYDYDNSINLAEEIKRMLISSINTAKKNNSKNLTSLKLSEYTLVNKDYKYYQK